MTATDEGFLAVLASKISVPADQLLFISCLLLTYPLSFLYLAIWPSNRVSKSNHRSQHGFLMVIGIVLCFLSYGWLGLFHAFLSALYSYGFMYWMVNMKSPVSERGWVPKGLFLVMMGHLSYCHLYRQIYNPSNPIDLTGTMMIVCTKVTSFAWNVWDGLQDQQAISSSQKRYAVTPDRFPSLLEYLGFIMFFPGVLTGPAIEYNDYQSCVTREWLQRKKKSDNVPVISPKTTFGPSMKRLGGAILVATFHVVMGWYFTSAEVLSPAFLAAPDSFQQIFKRLVYIYLYLHGVKAKFYFVWMLAEGAYVAMGAGGSLKENEKGEMILCWDGMSNQNLWNIETATSFQTINRNWNTKTHHWLKNYVYIRVINQANRVVAAKEKSSPVKKEGEEHPKKAHASSKRLMLATIATYVVSAFWHGFYPGYYLTFVTGAVYMVAERMMQQILWPLFCDIIGLPSRKSSSKADDVRHPHHGPIAWLLGLICWALSQLSLTYITLPFALLYWNESLMAWNSVRYIIHIGVAVTIILATIADKVSRRRLKKLKVV